MEIKGPNLNSYPSNNSQISRESNQLQNGQILKAVVAEINNNKVLFELIEPKLALNFEARANSNFKLGQIVTLQIINSGPPLSLNVLDNTNISNKSENIINRALRLVLPKQASMNQLLANLQYLSTANPKLRERYPQEIIELSKVILQELSNINDIKSATGIKLALRTSGVYLEQQLLTMILNKTALTKNDTRTSLLRLAVLIRSYITNNSAIDSNINPSTEKTMDSSSILKNNMQLPLNEYSNKNIQHSNIKNQNSHINNLKRIPENLTSTRQTNTALNELLRNIESSLAKTQYNQLQHFVVDDPSKTHWFFDLPIKHEHGSDIIQFRFTKEENSNNDKSENEWSVTLCFDLEKLGHISIQIYLRHNTIGATVWAKNDDTVNLFKQHLPTLHQQMERSGINISNIRCNKGEIFQHEHKKSKNVLDEKV